MSSKKLSLAFVLALATATAHANIINTYTLTTPATFSFGATLTGSWSYDTTLGQITATSFYAPPVPYYGYPGDSWSGTPTNFYPLGTPQIPAGSAAFVLSSPTDGANLSVVFNTTNGQLAPVSNGWGTAIWVAGNTGFTPLLTSGAVSISTLNTAPVPEPESYALMIGGLLVLGLYQRRKTHHSKHYALAY